MTLFGGETPSSSQPFSAPRCLDYEKELLFAALPVALKPPIVGKTQEIPKEGDTTENKDLINGKVAEQSESGQFITQECGHRVLVRRRAAQRRQEILLERSLMPPSSRACQRWSRVELFPDDCTVLCVVLWPDSLNSTQGDCTDLKRDGGGAGKATAGIWRYFSRNEP